MEPFSADGVSTPIPGRCAFYVVKKKRYCKMVVGSGKRFCGEHANADENSERKRIPCPLDPKHTVFEENLAKHLKKCNSKEKAKPVYYVKDINAGCSEDADVDEVSIADRSEEELDALVLKLKTALQGLNTKLEENICSHSALDDSLLDPKNGESAFKHLKQQASILGNMASLDLLSPNRCYVEFGAGKGKLSHWIHVALRAAQNVHFLLVERSSTRFKVDGKHKTADSAFERLQVDIQHLDLKKVSLLTEKRLPVVGVGKHLCGAATDLALRCLFEHNNDNGSMEPPCKRHKNQEEEKKVGAGDELAVSGLAIALCCHHRCDWRHYVGQELFRQKGLGPREFAAFQRMSSWATCGMRKSASKASEEPSEAEDEHETEDEVVENTFSDLMSVEDRKRIGRLCKLLIDQGRVDFLQQKGFQAALRLYTSTDVSLENVLLTALPRNQSKNFV